MCYPLSPRIMVQCKITLHERKLLLEIHPFSTEPWLLEEDLTFQLKESVGGRSVSGEFQKDCCGKASFAFNDRPSILIRFFSYQNIAKLHQGMQFSKRICDWIYPKFDQGNVGQDYMEKDRDIQIQTLRILNQMPIPSEEKKTISPICTRILERQNPAISSSI